MTQQQLINSFLERAMQYSASTRKVMGSKYDDKYVLNATLSNKQVWFLNKLRKQAKLFGLEFPYKESTNILDEKATWKGAQFTVKIVGCANNNANFKRIIFTHYCDTRSKPNAAIEKNF